MLDENKAREEIDRILQGKEYQAYQDQLGFFQKLWERAKKWLMEQLSQLFPSLESTNTAASFILILLMIASIILLGVAIFMLVRYLRRRKQYREQTPLQSMSDMKWTYQMHLMESEKQEAMQQYSLATRHLFLALLLYFHQAGWLEAKIWKTNWEYYEELRKNHSKAANEFHHLALLFDEVTYGEKNVQQNQYEQVKIDAMKWLEKPIEQTHG